MSGCDTAGPETQKGRTYGCVGRPPSPEKGSRPVSRRSVSASWRYSSASSSRTSASRSRMMFTAKGTARALHPSQTAPTRNAIQPVLQVAVQAPPVVGRGIDSTQCLLLAGISVKQVYLPHFVPPVGLQRHLHGSYRRGSFIGSSSSCNAKRVSYIDARGRPSQIRATVSPRVPAVSAPRRPAPLLAAPSLRLDRPDPDF